MFWLDKPHHDIVVNVLISSVVDHRFKLQSGQTKDYKIGVCCFYAKYTVLRSKSKDWLTQNQCVWVEWHLLFQWIITMKIQLNKMVMYKTDIIIISSSFNLFSPLYSWTIAHLALNNNHLLTLLNNNHLLTLLNNNHLLTLLNNNHLLC